MTSAVPICEIWRGPFLECVHLGHAVVCDSRGDIIKAWGDPDAMILPRSSSKMIQALPLITSGAADAHGLSVAQLALSCASHQGARIHTDRVADWLGHIGKTDDDFRCGPQTPNDPDARNDLIKTDQSPCQWHNNCSGKHTGFLTLNKQIGGNAEYIEVDHPVQKACLEAFEMVTDQTSPGYGIDGCSAPNYATTVHGLARAMAWFASAQDRSDLASNAAARLTQAMAQFPELVAGEGRACTELMRAMDHKVAIKTGAEGVFVAIVPEKKIGIALKAMDGATRASEAAIAALLVSLGVLDANHPATLKRMNAPVRNWRGVDTGMIKPAADLVL